MGKNDENTMAAARLAVLALFLLAGVALAQTAVTSPGGELVEDVYTVEQMAANEGETIEYEFGISSSEDYTVRLFPCVGTMRYFASANELSLGNDCDPETASFFCRTVTNDNRNVNL